MLVKKKDVSFSFASLKKHPPRIYRIISSSKTSDREDPVVAVVAKELTAGFYL